jgi:hypothetical protein
VRTLSEGLAAAGDPVVSCDGRRVLFAGKSGAAADWQIYEVSACGGRPRALTSMPGGAMSPALLADGSLVFASPVPRIGGTQTSQPPSALYAQAPGGQPRRLTFGTLRGSDATVLSDGRILFVCEKSPEPANPAAGPELFTVNNDGTEITAFAERLDPGVVIERPRELADGRVVFLVSKSEGGTPDGPAEYVHTARPFQSRAPLFPAVTARVRSVQPATNGDLLICAEMSATPPASLSLFRVSPNSSDLNAPLLSDPAWNICEAIEVAPRLRPMGRLSTVDPARKTGKILCLDANFSMSPASGATPTAARVRVLAELSPGNVRSLGEVQVQADGSFLAEVPADLPLGFETLDQNGRVLRREAPMIWLRPAENRSCIGCHEPRNRAPHNHRPLAVSVPISCLTPANASLAERNPHG